MHYYDRSIFSMAGSYGIALARRIVRPKFCEPAIWHCNTLTWCATRKNDANIWSSKPFGDRDAQRCPPYQKYYGIVNYYSLSPKAGHNKAGRSDFRNQRFEPDTGKMWKMRKVPLTPEKQATKQKRGKRGKGGKCGHENAENADDWL